MRTWEEGERGLILVWNIGPLSAELWRAGRLGWRAGWTKRKTEQNVLVMKDPTRTPLNEHFRYLTLFFSDAFWDLSTFVSRCACLCGPCAESPSSPPSADLDPSGICGGEQHYGRDHLWERGSEWAPQTHCCHLSVWSPDNSSNAWGEEKDTEALKQQYIRSVFNQWSFEWFQGKEG